MRWERVNRPTWRGGKRAEELTGEEISLELSRNWGSRVFQETVSEAELLEPDISNFHLLYSQNCEDL